MQYRKLLYTLSGDCVPDNFSANFKIASNFFNRFVTQEIQYLLGNGVTWTDENTKKRLGNDFDLKLQELTRAAVVHGVAFGFFNYDRIEVFEITNFVPFFDEEDGSLKAGIRFWQVSIDKPLRATLFELDGYTDYIYKQGSGSILREKRPYILRTKTSVADGTVIYDGENYPSFPIIPMYSQNKQSMLVGLRSEIDAYDLIKSGFANDLDDASQIYWVLENAGGMDDCDLAQFIQRMKTVRAVVTDDNVSAEAHTIEVPTAAREAMLTRLREDIYEDAMALDTTKICSGANTATQILAAYEPLSNKCDQLEYCVLDFISGILSLAQIDDSASFQRSAIVNVSENVSTILSAKDYLSKEYITKKILAQLGDIDKADEVLSQIYKESAISNGTNDGQQ